MQKLINAVALFAGAVSLGFVVTGGVLYANRDAIKANLEGQIKDAVTTLQNASSTEKIKQ